MATQEFVDSATALANEAVGLAQKAKLLAEQSMLVKQVAESGHGDMLAMLLTVFVLAVFVGYYVVWRVTPALHSPLMGVTNAISSVIVVGAILATGLSDSAAAKFFGFLAVTLASVNIFGGFMVTRRMLAMFKKKGS